MKEQTAVMSQSLNATVPRKGRSQESQLLDFGGLFREYQRPIYNYLLRMTQNRAEAEDLTQETFIRVDRGLPDFRGEASLSTWMYRIATNVSLDHFRRRTTRQAEAALSLEETESDREWLVDETSSPPEQLAAQSEMSACVQRFIRRLPPNYRAVLVLRDLQGLKNREVADVLGVSLDTVKIRLHRARRELRAALNAGCDLTHDERNVLVCEPKAESEEAGG
jgi:RNA polymerase sigma-70 factor (ECF subfamily)